MYIGQKKHNREGDDLAEDLVRVHSTQNPPAKGLLTVMVLLSFVHIVAMWVLAEEFVSCFVLFVLIVVFSVPYLALRSTCYFKHILFV